jgi:hypothetical protein
MTVLGLTTPVLTVEIGFDGVAELVPLTFSFASHPVIQGGDTLVNTPPVLSQARPSGQPALTFGTPVLSGGSVWTAPVTINNGTRGARYSTFCRARTAGGFTIIVGVTVVLG